MVQNRFSFPTNWVGLFVVIVLIPFSPLLISFDWDWLEAWAYAIVAVLGFGMSRWLVWRRWPDLLSERAQMLNHPDAKSWDRILAPAMALGGGLIPIAAGFERVFGDVHAFSLPVKSLALAGIILGYVLGTWALVTNRYFSGMVRIQTDRGQTVVSSGPYQWVRHPGYTGAFITYVGMSFWLDSTWSILPMVLVNLVVIIRTKLEDETLQAELTGYPEYAEKTRYRLVPGVW
ncbi:MAG: isoprenylcysteine carboxylmethyltransferase family protein [Candidatus Marinimicrobia bacterium]|nr:isoprenylcysteine carboxylmethyltransferase family protein [Candidatus Neomarinimicrobiota bacterium]MCF7902586.1 isoprenylcysteine carboxylmethyltransferase family protein [Candidatus Neomarinimicrobiota bacterium]